MSVASKIMAESMAMDPQKRREDRRPPAAGREGRRTLILLALVCIVPVVASYLMYYLWRPTDTVNHGDLVTPAQLPAGVLEGVAGQPDFSRGELDGRWTLVTVAPAACGGACDAALYTMRQSRLAQGKEMPRVARLWLVTDDATPAAPTLAGHDGLRVARAVPAWLAQLPGAGQAGAVWLVDPMGNVMMRYARGAAPKGVIKDLERLLKYSPLGRAQ